MKHICLLLLVLIGYLHPTSSAIAQDYVICSGGPALRKWEDFRVIADRHDKYGGNFTKAAWIRMKQLREQFGAGINLTWLVYRPAYDVRVAEEASRGQVAWPFTYSEMLGWAQSVGARVVYFRNTREFAGYLNGHTRNKMTGFEYFGHSNLHCFMFDYSCEISGASVCYLHNSDLGMLRRGIFTKEAFIKSWGCNTGKSMSAVWRSHFGVGMWGATDKTDYSAIGDNRSTPTLMGGRWVR